MTTATLIALLVGTVIPGITAAITKKEASVRVKAIVTALLSAIAGGLNAYLASPPVGTSGWETFIGTILVTWIASAAAYYFGWKPTGAASAIADRTPNFGFGTVTPPSTPPAP